MSWMIKEIQSKHSNNHAAIESLKNNIQTAAKDDILMVCVVEDDAKYGNNNVFSQKADTKKLVVVGSAD